MSNQEHPEDQPWNDVPADDDLPDGVQEPAPAEVVGDEDDEAIEDLAAHPSADPLAKYVPESLDQRLAEEEPDRLTPAGAEEASDLVDPRESGGDVGRSEPDRTDGTAPAEEPSAEEAAVHVVDDDRIL